MDNTFLKDHVYINMSKKYSEEFEELIGDINNVLESKIGMRICYDKNDSHMDHSTKPQEDCFSGFAILSDNQSGFSNVEIGDLFKNAEKTNNDTLWFEHKTYSIRMEQSKETDQNLHIYVYDTDNMEQGGDWIDRLIIEKGRI